MLRTTLALLALAAIVAVLSCKSDALGGAHPSDGGVDAPATPCLGIIIPAHCVRPCDGLSAALDGGACPTGYVFVADSCAVALDNALPIPNTCGDGPAPGDGASDAGGDAADAQMGGSGVERFFSQANPGARRFDAPEPCDANGACTAGKTCFHLAAELAVCDTPQPIASVECTVDAFGPNTDECACNGLTCGDGQVCISVSVECSCAPHHYNTCADTACTTPADCGGNTVCTPSSYILPFGSANFGSSPPLGRCFTPKCASDADCSAGPGGRCSLVLIGPLQAGQTHLFAVECVYAGSATACGATGASGLTPLDAQFAGQCYTGGAP